jgi:hypothetical protein
MNLTSFLRDLAQSQQQQEQLSSSEKKKFKGQFYIEWLPELSKVSFIKANDVLP